MNRAEWLAAVNPPPVPDRVTFDDWRLTTLAFFSGNPPEDERVRFAASVAGYHDSTKPLLDGLEFVPTPTSEPAPAPPEAPTEEVPHA